MSDSHHREMSHLIDAVLMPPVAAPAIIPSSAQRALELATTGSVRRIAMVTAAMQDTQALSRLLLETALAQQCNPAYQSGLQRRAIAHVDMLLSIARGDWDERALPDMERLSPTQSVELRVMREFRDWHLSRNQRPVVVHCEVYAGLAALEARDRATARGEPHVPGTTSVAARRWLALRSAFLNGRVGHAHAEASLREGDVIAHPAIP